MAIIKHLLFGLTKGTVLGLLITLFMLVSCNTPGERGPVWLGDPVITSGLDQNGNPVDSVEIFDKDVKTVYCYMTIKGPKNFKIWVRWYFEDEFVAEQFVDFGEQRKAAPLLNYHNGEPIPPGNYSCEFGLIPEKPLRSVKFRIEEQ